MTIVAKIVSYAKWYDGRKEKKGNKGFEDAAFEKEMKSAGWYLGAPWCMFFVLLIWRKVFVGDTRYLLKGFNGSAKQTADNVVKAGLLATGHVPEVGALAIYLLGKGPQGHAAIVGEVDIPGNTIINIEGNTNGFGSRDGEVVNANKPRTINRDFKAAGLNIYLYIYPRLKNE